MQHRLGECACYTFGAAKAAVTDEDGFRHPGEHTYAEAFPRLTVLI